MAAVVPIGKRYDSAHGSVNFYLFFFFLSIRFSELCSSSELESSSLIPSDENGHLRALQEDSG